MTFLEFHRYEIDAALYVSPFDRWADKVEKLVGHSLDGDQQEDGYSLDGALEAFEQGQTVQQYAASIQ